MKPQRVATGWACSTCGLDWDLHERRDPQPELSDCVALLKAELAKARAAAGQVRYMTGSTVIGGGTAVGTGQAYTGVVNS